MLSGGEDSDGGWRTDSSCASSRGDYSSANSSDRCGDGGRYVALFVDDDSREEQITQGVAKTMNSGEGLRDKIGI